MNQHAKHNTQPRPTRVHHLMWLLVALAAGCGGGTDYDWVMDDYGRARKLARENDKHLFVYYRWWMSPECGTVERDVLENPEIKKLFRTSVNCWLHLEWQANQAVMEDFGVHDVPAFVIVAPDGTFEQRSGATTPEQFEPWVRQTMPPPVTTAPKKP